MVKKAKTDEFKNRVLSSAIHRTILLQLKMKGTHYVSELARKLSLDGSDTHNAINELERIGCVTTWKKEGKRYVAITEQGLWVTELIEPEHIRKFIEPSVRLIGAKIVDEFLQTLDKIHDTLNPPLLRPSEVVKNLEYKGIPHPRKVVLGEAKID